MCSGFSILWVIILGKVGYSYTVGDYLVLFCFACTNFRFTLFLTYVFFDLVHFNKLSKRILLSKVVVLSLVIVWYFFILLMSICALHCCYLLFF